MTVLAIKPNNFSDNGCYRLFLSRFYRDFQMKAELPLFISFKNNPSISNFVLQWSCFFTLIVTTILFYYETTILFTGDGLQYKK